jgi:transposase
VVLSVSCGGFKRNIVLFSLKNALKITILPDLEGVSKEALYTENVGLKTTIFELEAAKIDLTGRLSTAEFQLAQLNRLVFGQTRERFVAAQVAQQGTLFNQAPIPSVVDTRPDVVVMETVKQKGQKVGVPNPNHNGRNAFPEHLRREVEILIPQVVLNHPVNFIKIGQIITETLDYTPAKLFVRQQVREKYAFKPTPKKQNNKAGEADNTQQNDTSNTHQDDDINNTPLNVPSIEPLPANRDGIFIAPLPERALPKSIAGSGLLAQVMVDKFVDHLPIDRQAKRWKRESGIDIKGSTVVGWIDGTCDLLMPLYDKLTELVFDCRYLQADESTLKSLENAEKGKTHTSYQWVYRNTEKNLILFDYQRHRSGACLHPYVKKHQGFLQTDGYSVYDALEGLSELTLVNCLAHARREFFEAKSNDPKRAEIALTFIQQLYQIEKEAKDKKQTKEEITKIRQEKCPPILKQFKEWLQAQQLKTIPKSPIGKAIAYTLNRWAKLSVYATDGNIDIDNNLIENAIRPLALGRKNYLFVGSDEGGKRTAMMYSFFATCKAHQVNPLQWLTDVLNKIPNYSISKIHELLPHIWKKG